MFIRMVFHIGLRRDLGTNDIGGTVPTSLAALTKLTLLCAPATRGLPRVRCLNHAAERAHACAIGVTVL
jgi:hypothetical protein